jgi:hypothetical protein
VLSASTLARFLEFLESAFQVLHMLCYRSECANDAVSNKWSIFTGGIAILKIFAVFAVHTGFSVLIRLLIERVTVGAPCQPFCRPRPYMRLAV